MEFIPLAQAILFLVKGKDAERYLNARLTQNIKALSDGGTKEYAALSAMGKVMSYGLIKKISSEEYFLLSDGGDPEEQRKCLSQFIVADRVTITTVSGYCYHLVKKTPPLPEAIVTFESTRFGNHGYDICLSNEISSEHFLDRNLYEAMRIRHGKVSYPGELNEKTFLSEWSRSGALCFGKGCYVGQETVEKIDAVGATPKKIIVLTHREKLKVSAGEKVFSKEGEVLGIVLSAGYDDEGTAVFVRIVNEETKCYLIKETEYISIV